MNMVFDFSNKKLNIKYEPNKWVNQSLTEPFIKPQVKFLFFEKLTHQSPE